MKRILTFKCPQCDNVFDDLVEFTHTHICPQCGGVADKIITCPQIKLEGVTGAFPGAAMSWERKRAEKMAQEQKQNS